MSSLGFQILRSNAFGGFRWETVTRDLLNADSVRELPDAQCVLYGRNEIRWLPATLLSHGAMNALPSYCCGTIL